jgi:hypothetical protein
VTRSATIAVVGFVALARFAAAPSAPQSGANADERAVMWLAAAAQNSFAGAALSDRDQAGDALALRALQAKALDLGAERLDLLRERLGGLQHQNGSFGAGATARPLTWLALGALWDSPRSGDADRARRARAWLVTPDATGVSADAARAGTSESVRRALGFLQSARASARGDELPSALCSLAGGPFDSRAVYASAIEAAEGGRSLADEVPASALIAEPLYLLELQVAVLDHYRTSVEAATLAEFTHPRSSIEAELSLRFDAASGAWAAQPGGQPSIASTASALLIRDTLERWQRARLALPGADVPGDVRTDASYEKKALACEQCHATLQPTQIAQWRSSAHFGAKVGCAECHGTNHSTIFRESGKVAPSTCGRCHAKAVAQFANSSHARAEATLQDSALFQSTAPAARAACMSCHRIGERQSDGQHGNCNFCHTAHTFDAREAREPEACTLCHTGGDYPQDLAYRLSKHGALYQTTHDGEIAPTCATCHNPRGSHDDGFGITLGSSGSGAVLEGTPTAFKSQEISSAEFAAGRAEMVAVCTRCHSSRLAEKSLREADDLKREGDAHLQLAAAILKSLAADGYFGPASELALGPEHGRPDPNLPGAALLERFYQMWRFQHATAWKGAYHQSPSVANHASGTGTLDELNFIRAQAERWRKGKSDR